MARRKTRSKRRNSGNLKPAQLNLTYILADGDTYLDLFSDLSKINRRLYKQGHVLAIAGVTFGYAPSLVSPDVVTCAVSTAGDTWVVQNSFIKAKSFWSKQQARARKLIGKSVKPTWEDFKVYLDDSHRAGTIGVVVDGDAAPVDAGEWDYSKLLAEADNNTVSEYYLHLIGGDVAATDRGLILAYQDSRATVQSPDPDAPGGYSDNLYAVMAQDQDMVADEVAQNMEDENDQPPYDQDDYPGSDTNSDSPWLQQWASASIGQPVGRVPGFQAECGLVMVAMNGYNADGTTATVPPSTVTFHIMPGNYQGVLAEKMGQ